MDLQQQIEYWRKLSQEDLEAAEALLNNRKYRHALFFVHLAVEKMLKAHVTKITGKVPPRSHDVLRLADLARLDISDAQRTYLARLQRYSLEGRYPDFQPAVLSQEESKNELHEARSICLWLANQLK
ncbi:MAG: HEPN domain-containing protein [Thermoguttaceae bacterium]|jgi:HEPN domain-containing protein